MRFSLGALIICTAFTITLPANAASKADDRLHADALALVQINGTRELLQSRLRQMQENAKTQIEKAAPQCSAEFVDEWAKRMAARLNVDDFVEVVVRVFEGNFSDPEIKELISLAKASQEQKTATPSAALREKMERVMPAVQSEIIGGTAELGAKVGSEVGQEILKEHPNYCKLAAAPNK